MRRAITLARRRLGLTGGNPAVGCVIVRGATVIAEAATAESGRPHAEEQAVEMAGPATAGATAYVSLEPCGERTSGVASCAERLIAAGITRVIYAVGNPDVRSAGRGPARLLGAGVSVESGLLADEARDVYAAFLRPYGRTARRAGCLHFPELNAFTDEAMRENGYTCRHVSVFDHFLTKDEASECGLFSYELAVANGLERIYLDQERRFLAFYKNLFAGGVIRRTQQGSRYIGIASHERWDRRLKRDVARSLRERGHMDVYVPAMRLRIMGGWDRTDALLFRDGSPQDKVEQLAADLGLFII